MNRKYDVDSGEYFNDPDQFDWMSGCTPVDMNGAFVPADKNGKDNLKDAQANIRRRFNLGGED